MNTRLRVAAAASLFITSLIVMAPPAQAADLAGDLISLLKQASGEPDEVEMARYYIVEPTHASAIYAHVAAQDYVFIAILGAAKAVRNQTIPGTSIQFNESTCNEPMTLFNAAFAQSNDFIDQHGDDPAVKAYLHAQSDQAKQDAGRKLVANVPYLGEVDHICNFTFHTDFRAEQQLRETISGTARSLKQAFDDFSHGDIVDAVEDLATAGITTAIACKIADEVIDGGAISSTPVIGDLEQSLCAGVLGKVIGALGTAVKGGITAISNLGDKLAGQSKNMPGQVYYEAYWQPHIVEGAVSARAMQLDVFEQNLWVPCVSYFDSHTMSGDSARETCDFMRSMQFDPAVKARLDKENANKKEMDAELPVWDHNFRTRWIDECLDATCESEVAAATSNAVAKVTAMEPAHLFDGWPYIRVQAERAATPIVVASVNASKKRFTAMNKEITKSAAPAWQVLALGVWTPRCADPECVAEVKTLAANMVMAYKLVQMANPDESSSHVAGVVNKEYGAKFQKVITESEHRKILNDPNATAEQKLPIEGCKRFLGREREWLCTQSSGFAACTTYVKGATATACYGSREKAIFATPAYEMSSLHNKDCVISAARASETTQRSGKFGSAVSAGPSFTCKTQFGLATCREYHRGGMNVTCHAVVPVQRASVAPVKRSR
jgi:hypothetical protein